MPVYPPMPEAPGHFPLLPQDHDEWGDPICPVCRRPLRAGIGVLRHRDQMVHVECAGDAASAAAAGADVQELAR